MRPRCCFRYLTFFGINMMQTLYLAAELAENAEPNISLRVLRALRLISRSCLRPPWRAFAVLFFATAQRHQAFTLVQPHLDPDLAVSCIRFRESVVDIRAQRLQWQLTVEIPLGPR